MRLSLLLPLVLVFSFSAAEPAKADRLLKLFNDEFVLITPGKDKFPASFTMGSDRGPDAEQPAHKVNFKYSFAIAKYEVTQELYELIMGNNPSRWKGPRNSVEMITWDEAVTFCKKATGEMRKRKLLQESEEIRLPTEAEWEYACRAGTTTAFSFGDDAKDLTLYAWFTGNAKGNDPPVGAKKGNPWGLFDMHGYVWEWCADSWHPDYKTAPTDGTARLEKETKERVVRGGAWTTSADECRSAFRGQRKPDTKGPDIGFRCVRAAVVKEKT
jgi:formylglycine-generating enzyme required for sulfatase activity